jgi:hypothetical protein
VRSGLALDGSSLAYLEPAFHQQSIETSGSGSAVRLSKGCGKPDPSHLAFTGGVPIGLVDTLNWQHPTFSRGGVPRLTFQGVC